MIIVFNLIILGLILLIAYWLANEGLFSSLLHLVCVIVAGATSLSLWEPVTMAILKGGKFDNYAWGVVLVGIFVILLFFLRLISDKMIPANIQFPPWVNLAFGGVAGACSGVLSIGICLIGVGFIQSSNELMEYRGMGRDENSRAAQIGPVGEPIWVDIPKLTTNFFSMLSVGTFYPDISGSPLRHYNPNIDELSTLVRDSYDGGRGQLSLAPDAAKVTKVAQSEDGMVVVQVSFNSQAKDFGGQLSISSSQVRLVGDATGQESPDIFYPISWKQEVKDIGEVIFKFDNVSHYATSVPGLQNTSLKFAFDTRDSSFKPRFVQIRGTRLPLPSSTPTILDAIATNQYRGTQLSDEEIIALRDPLGKDIQHLFDITSKIRKLRISTNSPMDNMEYDEDNFLVEGSLVTPWTHQGVSSALAINGIRADAGTAIVQLNVNAGENASFEDLLSIISEDSPVTLVDTSGHKYPPIGFYIGDAKRMQLTLTPSNPIRSIGELPMHLLTSSNPKDMMLIFQITEGEWIKEFRVGDFTIGTCNIQAIRNKR